MPRRRAPLLLSLALLGLAGLVGGCEGYLRGVLSGPGGGPEPEPDAGPEAEPSSYRYASTGTRSGADGGTEVVLILSPQPVDCLAHATALRDPDPDPEQVVILALVSMSFAADHLLCEEGVCYPTRIEVDIDRADGSGGSGRFQAQLGRRLFAGEFTAVACDYDGLLP